MDQLKSLLLLAISAKMGNIISLYDEVAEGIPGVTKNKIKISGENMIEIMKNGIANTHMVFEKGKKHMTGYGLYLDNLLWEFIQNRWQYFRNRRRN